MRILEWVAMPFSLDLPNPGIKPVTLMSPALAGRFFTTSATWKPCLEASGDESDSLVHKNVTHSTVAPFFSKLLVFLFWAP